VKVWVPDPERFRAVNVGGLRNALTAASSVGARLVYTSSFIAIGPAGPDPADESRVHPMTGIRNLYERTKAEADVIAREAAAAGQDLVILYPGVVYGPGDMTEGNLVARLVSDHLRGRLPALVGPGNRLWSYSYVTDVADGHALALEKGKRGERYFLCGENATLTQLFALVQEMTGAAPPRWHLPYGVASALGRGMWIWAELTGLAPQMTQGEVGVFREHWAYSSAKAERELGYRSRPLREGLRATLDWLREKGAS
jgi:farnesol dehydrogenase